MSGDWRTRLWDQVRGRHRCGWHGPPGEPPCEWMLGRDDPPTCPDHTALPAATQRFMRRPKASTSTEETP